MPKEQPMEIFMPPNVLKAKVGSGGIDAKVLKRAEQVIEDMKEEFEDWIVKDVENLSRARQAFEAQRTETTLNTLYRAAHDLRGQASTFDFPLVARVAHSLANLTDGTGNGTGAGLPMVLIDAHVDAIKLIVRDKIKDPANRMGTVLAGELEAKTNSYLEKHPAK
jgi:chemotaxis protein histidine kinase CheA